MSLKPIGEPPGRRMQRAWEALRGGFAEEALQRVSNRLAAEGKRILTDTTDENIAQPRWFLSGMAFPNTSTNYADTSWYIAEASASQVVWRNENPVFHFLEAGTRDHGPVRAKMLFIPLTREAALAHLQGRWGVEGGRMIAYKRTKKKSGETVTTARELVYGRDYILKKWVRGIEPRHIIAQAIPQIRAAAIDLKERMVEAVRARLSKLGAYR